MPTASRTETSKSSSEPSPGRTDLGALDGSDGISRQENMAYRAALEARTKQIGRELFDRIGRGPLPWHRAWWEDKFIGGTLDDPLVRVQLFRFIDALPALKNPESVRRHLAEYLAEAGNHVPWWLDLSLQLAPEGSLRAEWLAEAARASAGVMARKFIAGATPEEARQHRHESARPPPGIHCGFAWRGSDQRG